jgi:SEC-C motif-containing protein
MQNNTKQRSEQPCPCHSGKCYGDCCQKYHLGALPENALVLMRSRYSAYALGLSEYIIETTHPESPLRVSDRRQWLDKIGLFSKQTSFDGLDILDTQLSDPVSFVTFVAHLSMGGTDKSFTEKSRFLKVEGAWRYLEGEILDRNKV